MQLSVAYNFSDFYLSTSFSKEQRFMGKPKTRPMLYFSDFFNVNKSDLRKYGAFNISLINDLPLFVDPFLLFNSENPEYKSLHNEMIKYLKFLKDKTNINQGEFTKGEIKAWFLFKEVKQNWLGYSLFGNNGSGLNIEFAQTLIKSFTSTLSNFGEEDITKSQHPEKLCLIKDGIGKDSVSDFTVNLIKKFLLEYTRKFATNYISKKYLSEFMVDKVEFNYETETWISKKYILPKYDQNYVLLTPINILTKDESWINKKEMVEDFTYICSSIPNEQLRAQLDNYFSKVLPTEPKKKEREKAIQLTIEEYPEFIDYFIKMKEDSGKEAHKLSDSKIKEIQEMFIKSVSNFSEKLFLNSDFYKQPYNTFEETHQRVLFLKQFIENNDGYKIFYYKDTMIKRESDLQLLFRLTWFATPSDVNSEVNNGRGPVDYKISRGSKDKTLVEFKLASNKKLKQNLKNQVKIYEKANQTDNSIKVIIFFNDAEHKNVINILKELKVKEGKNIILIDATPHKISASNVK